MPADMGSAADTGGNGSVLSDPEAGGEEDEMKCGTKRKPWIWKCREPGCKHSCVKYADHVAHVVNVHGGLVRTITTKGDGK